MSFRAQWYPSHPISHQIFLSPVSNLECRTRLSTREGLSCIGWGSRLRFGGSQPPQHPHPNPGANPSVALSEGGLLSGAHPAGWENAGRLLEGATK